ncbi:signal peptidase I [bacterium]|nr:signal peptidase I [bacterium]|tara:strand:- start:12733 stop:13305 length:573 start_codon:yes stop_codon:yes gene_type:complete
MNPDNVPKEKDDLISFFTEVVKFVFLALIIVVPIRVFVAQPYIVSGNSMIPSFHNGDYLVVDQLSYRFKEPERGDVIIFRFPNDTSKFFIKRIIALPNETIEIEKGVVTIINEVQPDGVIIGEPYNESLFRDTMTTVLGEDEYFVMGDNRIASLDSRSWGVLSRELVIGRTFVRLFPVTDISFIPGAVVY